MSAPRVPKYQHFKPRDLAKVVLGGRTVYHGPYDSPESREKYDRVVAEWLANRSTPGSPTAALPIVTVSDVIRAYWDHARDYHRDSGECENLRDALRPVRRLYGLTPAKDFGPLDLEAVRAVMIRSDLSRKVINARVHRIAVASDGPR